MFHDEMKEIVLLLCSTHNDLGLIRALKKFDFYIVVTGSIENLPGQSACDEYIQADYSDKELILQIAREKNINYIIQCCNDFGVYTAAYVAEKLGLPGYDSYETVLQLHNKDKFKKLAEEIGIRTPKAVAFTSKEDSISFLKKTEFPIIVKPTDASAGNGISKAENYKEGIQSILYAFEKSRSKTIVIEPFINGEQAGFCTFLVNKKVVAICSNNEYSLLNPYRVEIDTFPASSFEFVKKELIEQIEKIAKHLNLVDGIFHLQYLYDGKHAHILEVMRRILGNMYHVPGNLLTGIDWEHWEVMARCGFDCSQFPISGQCGYFAYKTILAEKNGTIDKIVIGDEYKPYISNDTFLLRHKGDKIDNYKSQPIGFMFLQFESEEEMLNELITKYHNGMVRII